MKSFIYSNKDGHFQLIDLLKELIEWCKLTQTEPESIILYPEAYIQFVYLTQFITKPTFLGVEVKLTI